MICDAPIQMKDTRFGVEDMENSQFGPEARISFWGMAVTKVEKVKMPRIDLGYSTTATLGQ